MRLLDILLVLIPATLVFAPITGYIAASHGRSFWRWYGLGILLPFASVFVALFVAMWSQVAETKAKRGLPKPPP
ncbi:hypothetical protein [Hymenobacter sp. B1770]|uniref:hypothetical protein n=1 Tax=Hymenobacter sp. B1770 TaxID=1718788 RepID=UPI003CED417C